MVREERAVEEWVAALQQSIDPVPRAHHMNLLVRPKSWVLNDREILNARAFTRYFHDLSSVAGPMTAITRWTDYVPRPVALVELLLKKVFLLGQLVNGSSSARAGRSISNEALRVGVTKDEVLPMILTLGDESAQSQAQEGDEAALLIGEDMSAATLAHWIDFLNGVACLQVVQLDVAPVTVSSGPEEAKSSSASDGLLNQDELLCLFLNLYHVMLLHGFLVLGVPDSVFKWSGFFGSVAYEAFGDVFSLVELEHCILRHGQHKPSLNLFFQSYLPTHRYAFSLARRRDFRLLWAINCGSSMSCLSQ